MSLSRDLYVAIETQVEHAFLSQPAIKERRLEELKTSSLGIAYPKVVDALIAAYRDAIERDIKESEIVKAPMSVTWGNQ